MKKSLIVIKPLGVAFPEDCIKSCWDNHNAIFGALAWNKDALKLEKVEFEKLRDVEEWVKEINEDWTAILHFGGRYPVKDAAMPYFKENVENDNWCYYCHSGDLDLITSFANEDLELFRVFLEPVSVEGMISLVETFAEDPKNGQFLLYTNKGELRQLGKGWEEENGIIYSNSDHKKKIYTPSFAPSLPPVYSSQKEKGKEETPELDFFGLKLAKPKEGISRYFQLPAGVIARVDSSTNPLFKPMDWIVTMGGTHHEWDKLPEFIRKKNIRGGIRIHMKVLRFNQIAWSQFKSKDAYEELALTFDSHPAITPEQRRWIVTQLVNKMFKDQSAESKENKRDKYASYKDEQLIDLCERYDVNDWVGIAS